MVDWARRGYDVVIFTYGVTGSGKTFTMLNMESQPAVQTPEVRRGEAALRLLDACACLLARPDVVPHVWAHSQVLCCGSVRH